MPGRILQTILRDKRDEVARARAARPESQLLGEIAAAPRGERHDFAAAIARGTSPRPRVIAEVKRASPSAGPIRPGADAAEIATEYVLAGAAAVSVLTDRHFDGAPADLERVRAAVKIPVLRKDFIVDPYQVLETRALGADALLLIAAALDDPQLGELLAAAREQGLAALVEVHDAVEVERAVGVGANLIGINSRDLRSFTIDRALFAALRPLFPRGCVLVAESGIRSQADVRAVADAGADAILVGEALMREPSPGAALRELLGA